MRAYLGHHPRCAHPNSRTMREPNSSNIRRSVTVKWACHAGRWRLAKPSEGSVRKHLFALAKWPRDSRKKCQGKPVCLFFAASADATYAVSRRHFRRSRGRPSARNERCLNTAGDFAAASKRKMLTYGGVSQRRMQKVAAGQLSGDNLSCRSGRTDARTCE